MRSVTVFCGSRVGARAAYADAARAVGVALARRGLELVYGAGSVGLMGILADAALGAGGRVVGVIPELLDTRELRHPGLSATVVVPDINARKVELVARGDAYLAIPGGLGTLEEVADVLSWRVLGLARGPVGLLDVDGFFEPLVAWLAQAEREGFVGGPGGGWEPPRVDTDVEVLLDQLQADVAARG